ncbi:MAG: hypothetical protein EG828_02150 [Deltaproteobacteria bacterium]|nr:hypothetical protein [Deltaproteobacteria bacterium]
MKQTSRPLLVFLDTEFTSESDPHLISIGLATEDGRTFYAEFSDGWHVESCSEFVVKNVLPLLKGGTHAEKREKVGRRLASWLGGLSRRVRIAGDQGISVDWPLMLELLKRRKPANLCASPLELFSLDYPEFEDIIREEQEKRSDDPNHHHALHDAQALENIWEIYETNLTPNELESLIMGSDQIQGK